MKGWVPPSDKPEEHDHTQKQHVRRSNAINPKKKIKCKVSTNTRNSGFDLIAA
jgi:hypothetical protein